MGEWSAPVDRWVRRATDREDKVLGPAVRLLANELWSLADSPKKRGQGPAFIYGRWTEIDQIADDFACDPRTIRSQFRVLRAEGLAKRGRGPDRDGRDVRGIWLADVPNTGRFDPVKKASKDPVKKTKPSGGDAQTIRSHRTKPSGPVCAKDPVTPDETIRSPVLKEDPIKPYHSPTAPTRPPAKSQQPGLFGEGEAPKREPVAEVLAMFNEAKRETSEWAGLRWPTGAQNTSGNRKSIRECLAKYSGIDAGIAACRQVIEVQVHQARSHGKARSDTKDERKELKAQSGWRYFAVGNIFRADSNFGRWIERWDEDGNHETWKHKNDRTVVKERREPYRQSDPIDPIELEGLL